jgi:hypothetical protein
MSHLDWFTHYGWVARYGWALWLCVPLLATVLAAVWTWWRGRAPRLASTRTGIASHQAYLDALTRPAKVRAEQIPK